MAQEILSTFENEVTEVSLAPGKGGIFRIFANGEMIWCRKQNNGFPEIKQLKKIVRDVVAPGKSLGHTDS